MRKRLFYIVLVFVMLIGSNGIYAAEGVPGTVEGEIHYGYATFYGGGYEGGCCMLDPIPKDILVTALNIFDYDTAGMSGACLEVTGVRGTIKVLVTDLLPEGQKGDLDLNIDAFPLVADPIDGKVPISWRIVPCDVEGGIQYKYKEGSSQWWIGIQVRNHRYPVARLEYLNGEGRFVEISRRNYNYFESTDLGAGPYTFRVTDIYGHVITDENVDFTGSETIVPGKSQFPYRDEDIAGQTPTPTPFIPTPTSVTPTPTSVTPTPTPTSVTPTPTPVTPTPTSGSQIKKLTVSGTVKADIGMSDPSINQGFKVRVEEAQLSCVTDGTGSFIISDIPEGTDGKLVISKPGYLERTVELGQLKNDVHVEKSIGIWAGDMVIKGRQDGAINMKDVSAAAAAFNTTRGNEKYNEMADFNRDGAVNMKDIIIIAGHFNKTSRDYTYER